MLWFGQVDRGEYFPVETEEQGYFCEYWISPNFQTCLKLKESLTKTKTNVFLLEGRYYERGEVGEGSLASLESAQVHRHRKSTVGELPFLPRSTTMCLCQ